MKKKNIIIYPLLSLSTGFLLYRYFFTDVSYGMMRHHGYYDGYSSFNYYVNSLLIFIACSVIFICLMLLYSQKAHSKNTALTILNDRLSRGEISIEEYREIKRELL